MAGARRSAAEVARGVERMAIDAGAAPLREFPLPTGGRVDLMAIDAKGRFWAAEVKSGAADYRSDHKWRGYLSWCDAFYFAVGPDFPAKLIPKECGLIFADGYGAAVHREPEGTARTPLAAARRRALTVRFARIAATRLATGRGGEDAETPLPLERPWP